MKQAQVQIGNTYLTYIGQTLARVVVMRAYPCSGRTRFVVRREGEIRDLPKYRTAAALRETSDRQRDQKPEPYPEIQDFSAGNDIEDDVICAIP